MSQVRSLNPRQAMRSPPRRMSYEEFLDWDGENQHVEWVDGKVVPMPPITGDHSDLATYLITLFTMFLAHRNVGVIKADPFQMKTSPDLPGRRPTYCSSRRAISGVCTRLSSRGRPTWWWRSSAPAARPSIASLNSRSTSKAGFESIGCSIRQGEEPSFIVAAATDGSNYSRSVRMASTAVSR